VSSVVVSLLHSLRFTVRSRASLHLESSRSDTSWPSWIEPDAHAFVWRRSTACCGRGSRTHGAAGARRCTSSSRRPSSRGTGAAFACSGRGRAATGPAARPCRRTFARWFATCPPRIPCGVRRGFTGNYWSSGSRSVSPPSPNTCDVIHVHRHKPGGRFSLSREPDHGHRPLRRTDGHIPAALRTRDSRARPATA